MNNKDLVNLLYIACDTNVDCHECDARFICDKMTAYLSMYYTLHELEILINKKKFNYDE